MAPDTAAASASSPAPADPSAHAAALAALFRETARAIDAAARDPVACARVRAAARWTDSALRSYGLERNAQWFRALGERGGDEPARAPYAWRALAAPRVVALAEALEQAATLEPLVFAEAAGEADALALEACEEPVDRTQWLFAERAGERVAVPWDDVLEYGLVPGTERTQIVIAEGPERAGLIADWLHGKGTARRLDDQRIEDADGHVYRVLHAADLAPSPPPEFAAAPAAPIAAPLQAAPPAADTGRAEPSPGPVMRRVLVADDSIVARVFLSRLLRRRGFEVDEAEDGTSARQLWAERAYDQVFLDADMPGGGAFSLAEAGRPEVVVLVKDELERRHAAALGFDVVLLKPFAEDEVARVVDTRVTEAGPGG